MSTCLNSSSDSFRCLNGGQCSLVGICECVSACFVGNYCEISYNAVRLPLTGAIIQDHPSTRDVYIVVFVLFVFSGVVNNILALITFARERIRFTVCGIYLILFSVLSIALMITLLSYIMTIVRYNNSTYQIWACHVIPFVAVSMVDASILCTVAIAVERVLIECWDYNTYGSRKRALFVSIALLIYSFVANVDEIFTRRITNDLMGKSVCIYDFDGYPTWRRVDIVFSYAHVVIPCVAHLICSACVLTTIARPKIFIRSTEQGLCYVWLRQLYFHRDFLIPPLCLILCILPHGILGHLLQTCIPYSDIVKLRLHTSFVLLLYLPQMLSFLLYVYPNELYLEEFQQTPVYRRMCCYFYHKHRTLRQQKINQSIDRPRTSSTTSIMTVTTVDEHDDDNVL